jgi:glycosyltransferase involved in cell wall biosynthesis
MPNMIAGAGLTATSLQPRNLHITHSWGGGTSRWVEDFCRVDPYSENFVFESLTFAECYGMSYRLTEGQTLRVVREWTLQRPIAEVVVSHNQYAALLNRVIEDLGIDHLYISSVIGHSLDAYALDLPITVVYHDYFPFCPALNVYFGAICETCRRDELARCLRENPFSRIFRRHDEAYWIEVREAFFERFERRAAHHVAPTRGVVENLRRLDTRFERFDFSIIPHGVAFAKSNAFGGADDGRCLRMIVLGHLHLGKGLETIQRIFDVLRCLADLYFVGSGQGSKAFANRFGVHVTPSYDHAALPEILTSIRPDVALLLSAVPETFSFTLSELWAHNVPVVATQVGSFAERITPELDGFLVGGADEAIVDQIVELDAHRCRLRRVANHLASRDARDVGAEVDDYYKLQSGFADALERRIESRLASERC